MKMKTFIVWYTPYSLDNEEDFICIEAPDDREAARRARTLGSVTDVTEVDESLDALGWC